MRWNRPDMTESIKWAFALLKGSELLPECSQLAIAGA